MNSSEEKIHSTVIILLHKIAPEADLNNLLNHSDIRQTLGIDSFDFLNFTISISDTFNISIPEDDYGKLVSLADIIQYIKNQNPQFS